jgi:hypothetical protein
MQPQDQLPGFFLWQNLTLLQIFTHFWFDRKWVILFIQVGLVLVGYHFCLNNKHGERITEVHG